MSESVSQKPKNEFERLQNLAELDVDYSSINEKIDDLTKLAAHVTGTPISLVNLLEANTQWTISNYGFDLHQMPREDTVCQYVIQDTGPLEVENLTDDDRFKNKSYVVESPHIQYYYGIPLSNSKGNRIGALCVMDTKPKDLTETQKDLLKIIAAQVMDCIQNHHKMKVMQEVIDNLKLVQQKVTHDIRGPIGGIIGIAEIMESELKDPDFDEYRHFLELIKNGGQSVLEMADDILSNDFRISENVEEYHFRTNLKELQSKLRALYRPQALSKSIELNITILGEEDERYFPKHKLMQIFGNLITNAIKFTQNNGKIDIELALVETDQSFLKFKITDNGQGMNAERVNAILSGNPGSTAGTRDERGFGYGFQLARHLIESLNGDMFIESETRKGTSVTVHIPILLN
ncbi:MAG: GAF domain-containing sensor histidine kinase [Gracilimonas sp.]|nr:GAF domain-containing sensor histidine kinase [Gracilimonas sp.]